MAVFAALAISPAMAAEATTLTGEDAVQKTNFKSGEKFKVQIGTFFGFPIYEEYESGSSLIMEGSKTNRIETGLFKPSPLSSGSNITVNAAVDVQMKTAGGVNIIAGNAAEIKDGLTTLVNNNADLLGAFAGASDTVASLLLPSENKAPTVTAGNQVLMDGPGNAVMLGSSVTGKTITMTNDGTEITSAAAMVDGLLEGIYDYSYYLDYINIKEKLNPTLQSYLAPLQDLKGNFNIVQGSTIGNADTANGVITEKITMHASLEGKTIPVGTDAIAANIVLGGSNVTAQNIDLTGMASVITNTPLKNAFDELVKFVSTQDASELILIQNLLGAGKATSLTATTGNIKLGSQFNVLHGGNLDVADEALKLTANNGAVNIQGTANVLSGNVQVNAGSINLKGERLEGDLPGMVNGMISSLTDKIDGSEAIVDKLVKKGSFNVVTGGATLNATGNIVLNDQPVDGVGATGVINAVLDTELTDLITVVRHGEPSAIMPKADGTLDSVTTTLKSTNGNIDLLGRVNVVNGSYVTMEAGKEVNMQGNISMIGGAKVTADSININTSTEDKYKMYLDAKELGALTGETQAADSSAESPLYSIGVNGAIIAGGANVTATGKDGIEIDGTAGILVNTKLTDVMDALDTLQAGHEMLFAKEVLNSGIATTVTATTGSIKLGSQLNLVHGGGFTKTEGENTLTIAAENGAVDLQGTANLVSGNVVVKAGSVDDEGNIKVGNIHMHGEILDGKLAEAVKGFVDYQFEQRDIPGEGKLQSSGIIDKLVDKGSFNVVTGGATLEATGNIKLDSELDPEFKQASAINAVLDTQLTDVITAVINGEPSAILPTNKDVFKPTTTLTAGGDIDMLGRVNVVAGLRGNVVVDANGDVNLQGNLSMVAGNASVTGKTININTVEGDTYKMHLNAGEVQGLLGVSDDIANAIQNMGMMNAAVVAGGANLTSEGVDDKGNGITIGGTVGLLMNTSVADAIKELNPLNPDKNPSELEIVESLLQKGEATTLTAEKGNILVGSQFNLMHGGNMANDDAALKLSAANGAVNVEGTANVVSGNVQVNAKDITMTGEVLPADMAKAANGLVGSLTEDMGISGVSGVLNKLVNKGSVNMVTGGATLTATAVKNAEGEMVGGDITMTGKSVDDVGKIGNINAVIDTEMVDVLDAYINKNTDALVHGGGHMTTLQADGNINLEGRVNVVNGKYVTLDAGKDVNLQGNISMIGGATVNADGNIKINTSTEDKYKMYLDAEELGALMPGGITLPDGLDDVVEKTGVNAAVIAGGAKLEADGDITTGGTAGILVNTPMAEVGDRVMSLLTNPKHDDETWMVYELLQKGIATTVTSTNGNIVLGSQLNVLHGGNMDKADAALELSAANGAIKLNGTLNMVSGNVTMDAESINMTGEALKYDLGDRLAGMPGAEVLNKLNTYGSANVVLGGATLTATGEEGITMKGLANAVLDVELVDGVEAFMNRPDMSALIDGGAYETKLHATTGDINLLGRFNVVNGGKVSLLADKGDVNVNGGVSFIGGGATVTANNIKLNDDETGKYQMYFDSEELGAILPAGSPITEMLNTFGITDLLGTTGVNGAIVAGGANLTATGNITTGGTVSLLVNTPLSEVMKELEIYAQSPNKDETWMVYQLLQKGTATTVHADGNINLASRLNMLHGGNMGNANAALKLTAGNDIKMSGSANVVSGNVTMNADSINMKGEPLKFDMGDALDGVPGAEMLGKLAAKGSANIVTGGATLTATNNIKLDSMANFVLDTQATNVLEAFMEQDISFLVQGGNKLTSLNAGGNIDLTGRLNVVNGAYVKLNAGKDVNINGTLNMVSGKAKVNGANINLNGQTSVGLNWGEIIPGDVGNYMDQMGVTDKLNKGVNGNLVLGGSTLTATNDIKLSGMASVVTNVPLGSAFEALNKKMDETWQPELWLMKEMINDGIATTLTAENGNIEMTSRLNMLHGGNFGENGANALSLTAGKEVIIAGTANIISGNTQVTAGEGIKITGKTGVGFDWNQIAGALPNKYAGYGELAKEMGILDKLNKGVNGSVIAGGATLIAESGDITMEGMATAVVDVTAKNVLEAVETMNGTPIMEGGAEDTTITAVNGSINLNSRLNLVNAGQVTVNAGQNVNMGGTFNVVSGNATVNAGTNIEMNARNKVGVDISPMLNGHYAEIAKEMGMADVLENGVSSNIVAGGANLKAEEGDVVMSGVATAIVDTTASNVIGAVKGNDLGELMKGGRSTTEVTAGNDIKLVSQMNVVNGGNGNNAGGVVLNAGHDVIMSGDIDVVNRAKVNAGNAVAFNGDKSVVKYSDIYAGKVSFTGKNAEITDVNFNTASVEVIGTALVNTADSEVAINELIVDAGNIENLGSLELKAAALAGATLHNAGSIEVNGAMTLNSATLSFVADSNNVANGGNLTLNSTAITLGTDGSIAGISTFSGNSSTDMIAGVSFLLHYDGIEFIDNTNEFEYNLAIFQGATEGEYDLLKDAIAQNELTLTLDNGYQVESINSMNVLFDNGVVYISGTATVPEPTTATLSLLALAALAARRRRQK